MTSRRSPASPAGASPESRRLPSYSAGAVEVPFLIFGGREVIGRDTVWEEHSHPTHELLWNERGASTAQIGSRVWTITPTIGLWIPAGVPHSGFTPAGTWHCAAQFSVSRTEPLAHEPVAVDITALLRMLLERHRSERLPQRSQELTEEMILDVLTPSAHELLLQVPTHPLLAPIVAAVQADPADDTPLEQWARRLGVSTRTITRTFEAETSLTFRTWLATARVQHAVELIGRGHPIEEVADAVGYRSASAFTTAFRRVTGLTPGQFRRD